MTPEHERIPVDHDDDEGYEDPIDESNPDGEEGDASEFPLFGNLYDFYSKYEMPLARALYYISQRGILTHKERLDEYRKYLETQEADSLEKATKALGRRVVGTHSKEKNVIKIASPSLRCCGAWDSWHRNPQGQGPRRVER